MTESKQIETAIRNALGAFTGLRTIAVECSCMKERAYKVDIGFQTEPGLARVHRLKIKNSTELAIRQSNRLAGDDGCLSSIMGSWIGGPDVSDVYWINGDNVPNPRVFADELGKAADEN